MSRIFTAWTKFADQILWDFLPIRFLTIWIKFSLQIIRSIGKIFDIEREETLWNQSRNSPWWIGQYQSRDHLLFTNVSMARVVNFTWWREKNWSFQKVSPIFLDENCYGFSMDHRQSFTSCENLESVEILKKKIVATTHMKKKSNGGVLSLSFLRFFSSKSVAPIKWLPFVSREFRSRFWLVHIKMNSLTPPHRWRCCF